jgi:predicted MFS family arabinose efflux permease
MVEVRTDVPDWPAIAVVIMSVTAFAIAQGLTFPLIAIVLQNKEVSGSLIGLNSAVYAVGAATSVFAIDRLTSWLRADRLMTAALFGCSAGLAVFALISILGGAWLNAASPDQIRGRLSGFYGAGMCAGFAIGPLAIPLVGTENGSAFACVALYVALIGLTSMSLMGKTHTLPQRAPSGALLFFIRSAPVLVVMELAFGFADIAAISGMAVYFVRVGHSEAFAAYAITVLSLPTAIAQPLVGWLLDRASRKVVACGCGLVGAASFFAIPFLQSETAILIVFAIIGAATFALSTCALTILGERFQGGMLVAGTASFSLAYSAGSVMGSTGTGVVMDVLAPAAVPISVAVGLLAFAILMASHDLSR